MPTAEWREKNQEKMKAYRRDWYHRNRDAQIQLSYERKVKRNLGTRAWLDELKSKLSCTQCGENHPATIEFHHENPDEKEGDIGSALLRGWSRKKILAEMEKCTVLCSNCHKKLHYSLKQIGDAS